MRRAMVCKGRGKLSSNVEVDETLIGGEDRGRKRGRCAGQKSTVAIAVEVHNQKGFGMLRMQRTPGASVRSLIPFVESTVTQGSTILTDSWRSYNEIK